MLNFRSLMQHQTNSLTDKYIQHPFHVTILYKNKHHLLFYTFFLYVQALLCINTLRLIFFDK